MERRLSSLTPGAIPFIKNGFCVAFIPHSLYHASGLRMLLVAEILLATMQGNFNVKVHRLTIRVKRYI